MEYCVSDKVIKFKPKAKPAEDSVIEDTEKYFANLEAVNKAKDDKRKEERRKANEAVKRQYKLTPKGK